MLTGVGGAGGQADAPDPAERALPHRLTGLVSAVMPETSYRSAKFSASKWEEPDTVFGGPSDKKPYSKVETGSSFFSTYGYTNRKKDYVAEKVRDYYYFGDSEKVLRPVGGSSRSTHGQADKA